MRSGGVMAELAETPKRSQKLTQLERVCRLQRSIAQTLLHHPNSAHRIAYTGTASQRQAIEIDAQFSAGLQKIRRTLIGECHDQGLTEEIAQILRRVEAL
jgi:hypothetical protein